MIIRTSKRSHFVAIDYQVLADLSLSWEAKGLHAYLLSRPDNWQVSVAQLVKYGQSGRDKIYRMLKELIENGYAERSVERGVAGRIVRREIIVHENKLPLLPEKPEQVISLVPEKPDLVKPDLVKPDRVKPTLTNIDNKLILTIASSERPIEINWTPSDDVFQILKNHNIDRVFIESMIPEFIVYWRERNVYAVSWNSKFVTHVLRHSHLNPLSKTSAEPPQNVLQRFFDRSWANGLVANEIVAERFLEGRDEGGD